jgi:ABC-2 type transport system ATP-binding protein
VSATPQTLRRWVAASRARVDRHRRRWVLGAAAVLTLVIVVGTAAVLNRSPAVQVRVQRVVATPEPDGAPVTLDTTLYLPATTPAPAVLLAHGFGGSKTDLDAQGRSLAQHGYVVLAYSARGFGASGGLIHLDARSYEVADGARLLDYLQGLPQVQQRGGRPVVGVAGSSYGGALALMLGATDPRIGAVAADITWNNLVTALFPNETNGPLGVFKKLWAGYLFSAGFSSAPQPGRVADGSSDGSPGLPSTSGCGRFASDLCRVYQQAASGHGLDGAADALLSQSSPATVLGSMTAPTLLTQGEQDSLFPLGEADANARQLATAGAEVTVRWRSGGHDAPGAGDDVFGWQRTFFDARLKDHGTVDQTFFIDQRGAGISATNGRRVNTTLKATGYPGVDRQPEAVRREIALSGPTQTVSVPAGGTPAAVSSIPGLGDILSTAADAGVAGTAALSQVPGQTATFLSAPMTAGLRVIGSSTVTLRFSAGPDLVAFVALHDVGPDGAQVLPGRLVAPIRLDASRAARTATVRLPWVVADVPTGHRVAVVVSTTDFAYALPSTPGTYTVSLDASAPRVTVPSPSVKDVQTGGTGNWILAALLALALCAAYVVWRRRSRRPGAFDDSLSDVPIAVSDLVKEYADGYRAVDGVSFRVERGQVLGLLGPNGAGKTTTLRVLMGLILPTAGSVRVFGHEVVPGTAALSALGAFVEGPGLLPHLTGRDNLRLYWAASGRSVDAAELDTVLEIAGLGASLERKVKTYSHGMQQRLAIAQAMLGLPEVLVLDEPTNGLDPPQIAEMREVLHRYAATGRTVIVSSHLLAEVEQTCSHVVVMHRGRLVAAGSVSEVAGEGAVQLVVDDPDRARGVLAAAGIPSRPVPARRALEDVFLDLIGERND